MNFKIIAMKWVYFQSLKIIPLSERKKNYSVGYTNWKLWMKMNSANHDI